MAGRSTVGTLSERAGGRLAEQLGMSADSAQVYVFAFQLVAGFTVSLITLIAVSWAAGVLVPALVACAAGATLRVFAGGAHSATPGACAVVGAVICTAIGLAARALTVAYPAATLLTAWYIVFPWVLYTCLRCAPAAVAAKPIPARRRGSLRICALLLVSGWFGWSVAGFPGTTTIVWVSGTLGLIWQMFSLTPAGFRFAHRIDVILPKRRSCG